MRTRSPFKAIRHDGGNVALITALCLLPLLFLIGMSVDLSNATRVRLALQDATDSAALAVARNIGALPDNAAATTMAKTYIDASYNKGAPFSTPVATIDKQTLTVVVSATANVPTTFASILGKSAIPVSARAEVKGQGVDYEIALVVDNSGSMTSTAGAGSSKITELRAAAKVLFAELNVNASSDRVKIAIVPFASSVKVGSSFSGASWIDGSGANPLHAENFPGATRFDLFSKLNTSWDGCVESRIVKEGSSVRDYDVNDATPTSGSPATLFIPWFAPDEPDEDNGGQRTGSYGNDYLDDEGGACKGNDAKSNTTDVVKQQRTCKYKNPDWKSGGTGPNYQCTTTAITPLTNAASTLKDAIDDLEASGNTNVSEGLAWGWRVLSPTAPFTEGRSYSTKNLQKIIILMTDGLNNIPGASNQNRSVYSSYGYMKHGRLGTTSNNSDNIRDEMDKRVAKACGLIKAQGILIYTVALGPEADASSLSECASEPAPSDYASAPKTGAELTPTFKKIAASINKLRISQ